MTQGATPALRLGTARHLDDDPISGPQITCAAATCRYGTRTGINRYR